MHHGRGRHARQRTVREQTAEADRQQEERFEALDDREIDHHEAERDHDELAHAVGQASEHLHLVAPHERTGVVKVAADPLLVLVIVAVRRLVTAVGLVRVLAEHVVHGHAVLFGVVAGDVGGSHLACEAGDAGVAAKIPHLVKRFPPVAGGLRRETKAGNSQNSQNRSFHFFPFDCVTS